MWWFSEFFEAQVDDITHAPYVKPWLPPFVWLCLYVLECVTSITFLPTVPSNFGLSTWDLRGKVLWFFVLSPTVNVPWMSQFYAYFLHWSSHFSRLFPQVLMLITPTETRLTTVFCCTNWMPKLSYRKYFSELRIDTKPSLHKWIRVRLEVLVTVVYYGVPQIGN